MKKKFGNCKRKLKTTLHYEVVNETEHGFVPNLAGMEVIIEADNCRKRAGDEVSVLLNIQFVGKKCHRYVRERI